MDEFYNRHYITTDDQGRIASGWSDGPHPNRDISEAVCINDKGGYQFRLKFADGSLSEENPILFDFDSMIPLYKWDGTQVLGRTAEEIGADIAAIPEPETEPSSSELLNILMGVSTNG